MSNEFKLVPVELLKSALGAVEYLALRGDDIGTSNVPVADALRELLIAAPQPPALGGEPEVFHQYLSRGECARWHTLDESQLVEANQQGFTTRQLIDRAHIAPLQAEIERRDSKLETMRRKNNELNDDVAKLKARCDELEGLLRECRPALDQAAGGVFKEHRVIRDKVKAAMSRPAGSES